MLVAQPGVGHREPVLQGVAVFAGARVVRVVGREEGQVGEDAEADPEVGEGLRVAWERNLEPV